MIPVLPGALSRWVAGVLAVAMAGAWAGWSIRGHIADKAARRLQARIEHFTMTTEALTQRASAWQREYETARQSAAALEAALGRQNAAIARLREAAAAAETRARDVMARLAAYLATPTPQVDITPATCDAMVEQARLAALGSS